MLNEILVSWSDLEQYPDLLAAVLRNEDLDADAAEALILEGISHPRTCKEAVRELIADGEFAKADELIREPRFRLTEEEHTSLVTELVSARRAYQERLEARLLDLSIRGRQARVELEVPDDLSALAFVRTEDADAFLEMSAAEVSAAEIRVTDELRNALGESGTPAVGDTWAESLEAAISARQFDAARFMLDNGPVNDTQALPAAVPRRPPWPWREPLDEILGWFQATGATPRMNPPPEFYARWSASPDDDTAKEFVDALAAVALGPPSSSAIAAFSVSLDRLLGGTARGDAVVRATAGAFVVSLQAFHDDRASMIKAFKSGEVWVTVADTAHGERPSVLLSLGELGEEGSPSVDAVAILRLLGDPGDGRANFLREFGRQLNLSDAISPPEDLAHQLSTDSAVLRWLAAWTLDILDIDVDSTVPDVATHLCGGRGELLLLLLRSALGQIRSRHERLTLRMLLEASAARELHEQVRKGMVSSLDDPVARAVFGTTALLAETPAAAVSAGEVADALSAFWSLKISIEQVAAALDRLVADDLVRSAGSRRFALASSLAGTAAASEIGDFEAFVSASLDALL